ncbi:MAG: SipW-dependent-type signal peptide-containing protein, partial [Clostridia bacterium]|nr:SipW-dependent-type signal peptide-containing protein [Clostridia bacterium]
MKNTKKALLALTCAIMLVVGSVMGTMAYLTSTATVENTFTVGNVQIKLDEADVVNGGRTEEGNQYKLLPNQQYTKDPTVTVLAKSEDAYVRALVTVTYDKDADAVLAEHNYEEWFNFNNNWEIQPNVVTEKTDETIAR